MAYGWILPIESGKPRIAICLNGLSYEPTDAGSPADLRADLQQALTSSKKNQFRNFLAGRSALDVKDFTTDISASLLLIVGEPRLAEQVFAHRSKQNQTQDFMRLSQAFLSAWWDQAVTEHMQEQFEPAFHRSVQIQKFRGDYEKEARRVLGESAVQAMSQPNMGGSGVFQAYPFISPVEDLVNDCARRINAGPRPPLDFSALKKLNPTDRIKTLIDHLDDFQAKQMGQPGGINWMEDPIFAALVKEDRPALLPLIDTLENDTRLTLAVSFPRDFMPTRNLISVKDVARAAIGNILQWFNISDLNGKPATPEQIRQFIVKNGTGSKADLWFNVLADDQATPEQWTDAADKLLEPSNIIHESRFSYMDPGQAPGAPPVPINAEQVRSRVMPSLSDLLHKRASQVIDNEATDPNRLSIDSVGLKLAVDLAKWDKVNGLPVLAKATSALMLANDGHAALNNRLFSKAIQLRIDLGDRSAIYEYAQWLLALKISPNEFLEPEVLAPLVKNASSPDMAQIPEKLFLGPDSNLNLAHLIVRANSTQSAQRLIVSPLLNLPAVQKAVFEILKNKTSLGVVTLNNNQSYSIILSSSSGIRNQGSPALATDPLAPKPGDHREYRVCDSLAEALIRLSGAPKFEAYWPETAKDTAIWKLLNFLTINRSNLGSLVPWPNNWKDHPDFPALKPKSAPAMKSH